MAARGDAGAVLVLVDHGASPPAAVAAAASSPPGGRGRSRKRSTYYSALASYHNKFLNLLTREYQAEVRP
jgi:hypothetical protein